MVKVLMLLEYVVAVDQLNFVHSSNHHNACACFFIAYLICVVLCDPYIHQAVFRKYRIRCSFLSQEEWLSNSLKVVEIGLSLLTTVQLNFVVKNHNGIQ